MDTPTEVGGTDRVALHYEMETTLTKVLLDGLCIMTCMFPSNSNLKGLILFPPSELAGILRLNSLLDRHLWIIHMNSEQSPESCFISAFESSSFLQHCMS